ncbi:MAG: hypothetical protein M0R68_14480, partial [Bacteroidetes bacterium]|nr:hypothetical protein [Bacteroidota bacterium]
AVQHLPGEPPYLEDLGMALADAGQTLEAISILLKAQQIDKQNPRTFFYLGNLYAIKLGDPAMALPYFRERVVLDPDAPNGYVDLGNTYAMLGDYEKAMHLYLQELSYRPGSTAAQFNLKKLKEQMGK